LLLVDNWNCKNVITHLEWELENELNNKYVRLIFSCYFNIISLQRWVIVCVRLRQSIKHVKFDETIRKNNSKTNSSPYQNTMLLLPEATESFKSIIESLANRHFVYFSVFFRSFVWTANIANSPKNWLGMHCVFIYRALMQISINYSGFASRLTSNDNLIVFSRNYSITILLFQPCFSVSIFTKLFGLHLE
jgi:hypothetical protein